MKLASTLITCDLPQMHKTATTEVVRERIASLGSEMFTRIRASGEFVSGKMVNVITSVSMMIWVKQLRSRRPHEKNYSARMQGRDNKAGVHVTSCYSKGPIRFDRVSSWMVKWK